MENGTAKPRGGFIKRSIIVFLIMFSIYFSEGLRGFVPFLNLEALLLVFGGTFLLTWTVYPLKEMFRPSGPEVPLYAAGCAVAMGALATVLGMMLMLAGVDDVAQVPRRMALALTNLFFGIFLSEVVLAPMAARLAAAAARPPEERPSAPAGNGKRMFFAILALGASLFCMMTALYALSAGLAGGG